MLTPFLIRCEPWRKRGGERTQACTQIS